MRLTRVHVSVTPWNSQRQLLLSRLDVFQQPYHRDDEELLVRSNIMPGDDTMNYLRTHIERSAPN